MSEQNKQLNISQNKEVNISHFTSTHLSFLKDKPELIYIYKKTEKLLSAIYLISSLLSDSEPLKWELRTVSVKLLSQVTLSDTAPVLMSIANILSLLNTALLVGLISEMNFSILKKEFEDLIRLVESAQKKLSTGPVILSDHFFTVLSENINPIQNNFKAISSFNSQTFSKGQDTVSDRKTHRTISADITSNRQNIILDMLQKTGELGIKDFAQAISGCSEKTVQRELMSLISKGQVKKTGEKRWSRYSLK